MGKWGVGRAFGARTQLLGDLNSLTRLLRFGGEGISVKAPHFGEGAPGLAGSTLPKSLLPRFFSTHPTPPSASILGREHEGSFGSVCPRVAFPPSHPALPGALPGAGHRFAAATARQEVPKSSVLSQPGVTQNGEMRQVGARPRGVDPSPQGHQGVRAPRLGTESPTPAPALPAPHLVRGAHRLPWPGGVYGWGRCSPARVGEGMGAPARGPGPSCPPSRGRLSFQWCGRAFCAGLGRGFRGLRQGEVRRKPWPGEKFP